MYFSLKQKQCCRDDILYSFFFLIITSLIQKFMDDSEECLTRLGEEMKAKVLSFVMRLRECARTHCDTNGPAIQKNISRICQDQARLQEVRCGIENLMQENDPFRFIEVRSFAVELNVLIQLAQITYSIHHCQPLPNTVAWKMFSSFETHLPYG